VAIETSTYVSDLVVPRIATVSELKVRHVKSSVEVILDGSILILEDNMLVA
jgi:hypothetical protein